MILKIIKCSNDGWYNNLIGCDFFPDLPIENNHGKILTGHFKILIKYENSEFSYVNSVMCGILIDDTNYISVLRKEKLLKIDEIILQE